MDINVLTIYSNRLETQVHFYQNILGFTVLHRALDRVSLAIGTSVLHIIQREGATPYHFAMNIPANKVSEARDWLKHRTDILCDDTIEIHDFDFWNAEAVYCYDADHNIIEFIARKNLKNERSEAFSVQQVLSICEIGVPTDNIQSLYKTLHEHTGIEVYDGTFERFCAIGNEYGLFIVINRQLKKWFPIHDPAYISDFKLQCAIQNIGYNIAYTDGIFKVL